MSSFLNAIRRGMTPAGEVLLTAAVFAVLAVVPLPPEVPGGRLANTVRQAARTRVESFRTQEEHVTGYYEELLHQADNVVVQGRVRLRAEKPVLEALSGHSVSLYERVPGFRVYRSRPGLDVVDRHYGSGIRYRTNSLGFVDREYAAARAPRTVRIAIIGDSVTQGQGVPQGAAFEALFEDQLNATAVGRNVDRFEILNMAVPGYRITQMLDLALEDAPQQKPDAVLVGVSWLTIGRKWGVHLATLVRDGVDLKYPYLQQVVRDAHLLPTDDVATSEAKLARFAVPTLRWALRDIRARMSRDGVATVVLLLPYVTQPAPLLRTFEPVQAMLRDENFLVLNLLDAFRSADLSTLDVSDGHPNAQGHRLILEELNRQLARNPDIDALVTAPRISRVAGTTRVGAHQ
jgi:lysophospholipase L1-like esterase